jgi:formiminotetrahydrofolate cyclodeaminase
LIAMVGRLTVGKEEFADLRDRMEAMIATADAARRDFLVLADRDAHAFDSVMVAFRMAKETDEEKTARSAAIQAGYLSAAAVPREVARKAVDLMELAEDATAMGNTQAASDGLSAAASLYAAALCAIANVEINASSLKDQDARAEVLGEIASLRERADGLLEQAHTAFQLRLSS